MKPTRIPTDRLQAMLYAAHAACRADDCANRLAIRSEVNTLQNAKRLDILSAWAGDQTLED